MWTQEELNAVDKEVLFEAINDGNPAIRKTGVRLSGSYLKKNDEQVIKKLEVLKMITILMY